MMMRLSTRSIRPFIGAIDFELSRAFYRDLGSEEKIIEDNLSLFIMDNVAFYLQRYHVKDWIDNSMIFVEVDNAHDTYAYLQSLRLPEKYNGVRLLPVRHELWGSECFLHDPSGILWHFGEFKR